MEQNQEGKVDLLEIYHARQMRDEIIAQLRRLRCDAHKLPVHDAARRREVRGYYEAMLLTIAELLQTIGDDEIAY